MSSDNIGIGMLIGLQHRNKLNEADFAAERRRLEAAMTAADANFLSQKAQKEAVKRCIDEVVSELESGVERRHSDPDAAAIRGEDFIDTAEVYLNRLSSGRLSFSEGSVGKIKRSKADINGIVTSQSMQPEVERARPRRK